MPKRTKAKVRNPQYANKAIVTKYFGATNHRPRRVKAYCEAGYVWVSADTFGDNSHVQACMALDAKLGWNQEYAHAVLPDGQHVFAPIRTDR